MKRIFSSYKWMMLGVAAATAITACRYDVRELEAAPKASFTVTPVAGQVNRYLLTSTSSNAFRFDWDKGMGYAQGKKTDTVYFPDRGTYSLALWVFGQNGMDSVRQQITVAADDPAAITPYKLLTGNSSRKWKLAQETGALWIGPPDGSATWWQNNNSTDLVSRGCLFNDEYTFNKTGNTMVYDSKGDFYVDEEAGNPHPAGMPAVGCYANSAIPAQFQSWANNGTFTFDVVNNNKLKVNGMGAHLGLYKAANPPDAAVASPQSTITYDIISITATRMVLKLDYGWGAWRFTYVAM